MFLDVRSKPLHQDKFDINHYYNIVSNNNKTEAIDYSNNYTLCINKVRKIVNY